VVPIRLRLVAGCIAIRRGNCRIHETRIQAAEQLFTRRRHVAPDTLVSLLVRDEASGRCSNVATVKLRFIRHYVSRDSAVGIETGYGLDDRGVGVRVPVGSRIFALLHLVQTGSEVQPTFYPMGTGGSSPGVKAARE
jgi:hypothetical protein